MIQRLHFNYRSQQTCLMWLFRLPIITLQCLVVVIPGLSAFYFSLTDWRGFSFSNVKFIGFENFIKIIGDYVYWQAFSHNITYLIIFTTIPFIIALTAASLLASLKQGAMFFRIALFIPYILPSVVTSFIWRGILDPRIGLGLVFKKVGIPLFQQALLGRPDTALYTIAFIDNWHFWGFLLVLLLTAMQSISPELYDAAKIDGANQWNQFIYVTLPGIRPTLLFLLMMLGIWCFQVFDWIQIITHGGPGHASEVLSTYLYKMAISNFEAGYAAAIGITISLLALIIIGLFTLLRKRGWEL